jgi:signal peptidase II
MRRARLVLLLLLILIGDQETKHLARLYLPAAPPRHYGVLTLLYAENRGAFLSLGSSLPEGVRTAVFDGLVAIGLVAAAIVLFRGNLKRGDDVALAMIIAGGVGNLIDRLRFAGRVTDFLYLSAGPLHTGVFNLADMAITFGILWLLISWCRPSRRADSPSPPSR